MPGVRAQHDSQRVARQAQEGRHHRQDDVCLHVQIQQAAVRPRLYLHPPVQAGIHRPRGHRGHFPRRPLRRVRGTRARGTGRRRGHREAGGGCGAYRQGAGEQRRSPPDAVPTAGRTGRVRPQL